MGVFYLMILLFFVVVFTFVLLVDVNYREVFRKKSTKVDRGRREGQC